MYCLQATSVYSCIRNVNTKFWIKRLTDTSLSKYTLLHNDNKTSMPVINLPAAMWNLASSFHDTVNVTGVFCLISCSIEGSKVDITR
jgi:hypothetical protein